jgi:serine protease Do
LADSDKLEVGDVVLAVGNPFGVGQTVTMGIVSATGRGGMGIEDYEDFIQTDAAINPGNSGGALVDTEGRLIGINTAILSRTGGSQGVGFAVPVKLARHVMDKIVKEGRVVRGYLGVSLQDLTPELATAFRVPEGKGALIGGVTTNSAAAEAGLKSGDVVLELNGKPMEDSRKLKLDLGAMSPGAKVKVQVLRDGKPQTFNVTLKEMPEERAVVPQREGPEESVEDALSGVVASDIEPGLRRQLRLPSDLRGALIAKMERDSVAFEAGLRPGDVIQEINRQPIANAAEAVAAIKKAKNQPVLLQVWSRGMSRYLVVNGSKGK